MSQTNIDELFNQSYIKLNKEQKRAVDQIYGPVMVIAGPGTGKTTILSLRVANILKKTDVGVDSIIAITFTEAGVISMRKKLLQIVGKEAHKINITTFHGYCNSLIRSNPEYFPDLISSQQANDSELIEIIEKIIDSGEWTYLKPAGDKFNYVRPIKNAITHLKREGYTHSQYAEYQNNLIKEIESDDSAYTTRGQKNNEKKLKAVYLNKIEKLKRGIELASVYEKYEVEKGRLMIYDYEDMILRALEALRNNEALLAMQQEKYQFILVDEHQDSNSAQNSILETLTEYDDNPNLFIVGDEKQAIFRFQGASLENFLYFKRKYPKAEIIKLKNNYRSNQRILDASFSLIENNNVEDDLFFKLKSSINDDGQGSINLIKYLNLDEEHYCLARDIKAKIDAGQIAEEIAIIYRNNAESDEIARYLESFDIKFSVKANRNLLDEFDIRRLRDIFKLIVNLNDNVTFFRVLSDNLLNKNVIELHKIINYSNKNKINLVDIVQDEKILNELRVSQGEKIVAFTKKIIKISNEASSQSAARTFIQILNDLEITKDILKSDTSLERLQSVNVFFNELKDVAKQNKDFSIADFCNHLNRLERYSVEIKDKSNFQNGGVNLMTAHGSKGLEFDYVYIPHLESKIWGKEGRNERFILPNGKNSPLRDEGVEISDERRLLFVAMTRARKAIHLSYSQYGDRGDELVPSIFVDEINPNLINFAEPPAIDMMSILQAKFKSRKNVSTQDKEYIKELFIDTAFSVTALNNYLKCPWEYFYKNLIKIPGIYSKDQVFGNVIHGAIKSLSEDLQMTTEQRKVHFKEYVSNAILSSDLSKEEKQDMLDKALSIAPAVVNSVIYPGSTNLISEYELGPWPIEFRDNLSIKIKGVLDHIVITNNELIVIDYKTGKVKSEKEIRGETGDKRGDYYRQILFYKLLLGESKFKDYLIKDMRLCFVSTENGSPKIYSFNPSNQEVIDLANEIKRVANEIYNLEFWNKSCDDKKCQFCHLPRPE